MRFVALRENGTHAIFAAGMGYCGTHELTSVGEVVGAIAPGMLCLPGRPPLLGVRSLEEGFGHRGATPVAGEAQHQLPP